MQRIFTKTVGRYQKGETRDYGAPTWRTIEQSARKPLESFTKPVETVVQEAVKK